MATELKTLELKPVPARIKYATRVFGSVVFDREKGELRVEVKNLTEANLPQLSNSPNLEVYMERQGGNRRKIGTLKKKGIQDYSLTLNNFQFFSKIKIMVVLKEQLPFEDRVIFYTESKDEKEIVKEVKRNKKSEESQVKKIKTSPKTKIKKATKVIKENEVVVYQDGENYFSFRIKENSIVLILGEKRIDGSIAIKTIDLEKQNVYIPDVLWETMDL